MAEKITGGDEDDQRHEPLRRSLKLVGDLARDGEADEVDLIIVSVTKVQGAVGLHQ